MTKKPPTKRARAKKLEAPDTDAIHVALGVVYAEARKLGRTLHPVEVRWIVRGEFRRRFKGLDASISDRYADTTIATVRKLAISKRGK